MCFEICSNGEGRVGYPTVLKIAQAARKLIQQNPNIAFENASPQGYSPPPTSPPQGVQAGGPVLNPPREPELSSSAGLLNGGNGFDININKGVYTRADSVPSLSTSGSVPREEEPGVPGVATRNGGFEALAFPQGTTLSLSLPFIFYPLSMLEIYVLPDIVDYIFSAESTATHTKVSFSVYCFELHSLIYFRFTGNVI